MNEINNSNDIKIEERFPNLFKILKSMEDETILKVLINSIKKYEEEEKKTYGTIC